MMLASGRRGIAALEALLVVLVLTFTVSTVPGVRSHPGFHLLLDGWLQCSAYVVAAVLTGLRPLLMAYDRACWAYLAVALSLRAVGFVVFLTWVRHQVPQPYPSWADALWLAMCVVLLVDVVRLVRRRFVGVTVALLLDGLVGAAATATIVLTFLDGTLAKLTVHGTPTGALLTNLLYPAFDVLLLFVMVGLVVEDDRGLSAAHKVLALGVVGFAVTDTIYLYRVTNGLWHPGTFVSSGAMISTAAMGLAAWMTPAEPVEPREQLPGLAITGFLATCCLGQLTWAATHDVPAATVALSVAGIGAALWRVGRTVGLVRRKLNARVDELTGLPNRRAFFDLTATALRRRTPQDPLLLAVVGLNGFKDVNDLVGPLGGDELLFQVAMRLRAALGERDAVARLGGDEFGVLLNDPSVEEQVSARLRVACRGPFTVGGRTLQLDATVGTASYPDHATEAAELLQCATMALYDAKRAHVVEASFRPETRGVGRARLDVASEVQRALELGEFVPHFQAQVDLSSRRVVSVEALVRWEHPTLGLLAPADFLAEVARLGHLRALTLAMLEQSLAQIAHWRAQGVVPTVAVNLAVTDLLDPEFPYEVGAALDAHGLPGEALVLELTEDLFLVDRVRGRRALSELLSRGVRVQVDDYGAGFSTLAYLRDLPELGGIKLDRSFVTGMSDDSRGYAIVASTIGLAQALGLELVAEGVETAEVARALSDLGCRIAQGYLFGRPVCAAEFTGRW